MINSIKKELKTLVSKIQEPFVLQNILVFAAFIVPLLIIYLLDAGSFDYLWKGRAPYLLFLWLFILEAALGWKKLKENPPTFWNKKTVLATITLLIPTLYAIGLHLGLKSIIIEVGKIVNVPIINGDTWYLTHSWPFSFEYVLFAGLFAVAIWLLYRIDGLKVFSVSAFFVAGVGVFYMIDTFNPNGTFTVLQFLVPITTSVVAIILNVLGYMTNISSAGNDGLTLIVSVANGNSYPATIAWSCAGSHSLFLYSFMIMLFLRGTSIPRLRKLFYVVLGAFGTFFVNILRIVTIYLLGINTGESLASLFHEVYGEFFFIAWMFIYLTVIYLLETRFFSKKQKLATDATDSSLN